MRRSEFLVRLAVENKVAFVSDSVDIVQKPFGSLDSKKSSESGLMLLSLQSSEQDSYNNNKKCIEDTVANVTEKQFIAYDCSEISTYYEQKNYTDIYTVSNSHSSEGVKTTEQGSHLSSAEELCLPEIYHPGMEIPKMAAVESRIESSSLSCEDAFVKIISDITLKPASSGENKEFDQIQIETEKGNAHSAIIPEKSNNIILMTSTNSHQKYTEGSPHLSASGGNTDDPYWTVYKGKQSQSTEIPLQINEMVMDQSADQQKHHYSLPSDDDNENENSGEQYAASTDYDDISSVASDDVMSIKDVKKNYPREDLGKIKMEQKVQTASKITNQQYSRKRSARKRPTICPLCYEDVITHFPRHLSRHHSKDPEVKRMLNMKPNSKERLALVSAFRKRGYFILKTEKDILHPVRSSKDSETDHFVCTFCLGYYNRKILYRHVKVCKCKPYDVTDPGRNCQSKSQTFMTSKNHQFLKTSRLKKEVFYKMRADSVSNIAKSDPLICLYGEVLLAKHKRPQMARVVSNKIREMAKMLLAIRSLHDDINGLFDVLQPEMFETLVTAAKIISGYNEDKKSFRAPSIALHMGTNLKIVCNIALKTVIQRKQIPNMSWENGNEKKNDIKDFRKIIEAHWCNEISSLALKTLKERQWQKPNNRLPLTEDILIFKKYTEEMSERAQASLQNRINADSYKILTECVLAQTIMFNRKRIGDVQYLKIETYEKENSSTTQKAFFESLTELEKILCGQFKRVITDGKGSKPVPILFSKRTQRYIGLLLKIRKTTNIVPKSNPYLFANPGVQNQWMRGDYVIRMLGKRCGAKIPALLTSTKFRKHIATTLQLMNMGSDEMEQVATFMGHTKKTHAQFYRLPQDIYQTAKVAKVLLLLERGKGKEFRGATLEEICLDEECCYSEVSDEEDIYEVGVNSKKTRKIVSSDIGDTKKEEKQTDGEMSDISENCKNEVGEKVENNDAPSQINCKNSDTGSNERNEKNHYVELAKRTTTEMRVKDESTLNLKATPARCRWTSIEKKLVENYFKKHIKNRITPKKHECDQFLSRYGDQMVTKDWVKVKTFVYNEFRRK